MAFQSCKIIATLGPASSSKAVIRKLVKEGVSAFRINTAHGSFDEYDSFVEKINGFGIPVIVDLKGPEIRFRSNSDVIVSKGDELEVGFGKGNFYFEKNFYSSVKKGDKVLFEDGKFRAKIIDKTNNKLLLRFLTGAVLKDNKGVNVPSARHGLPAVSDRDKDAIEWAKNKGLFVFALSFVRNALDLKQLRKIAGESSVIVAKIESKDGVSNAGEIIREADGLIVARGDLGAEISKESIPLLQKKLIKRCINEGKFCIVATQMLESMIHNSYPTRAEVNDIANSVLDGADCLMLSGETAVGNYPIGAVQEMRRTCEAVEDKVPNFVKMSFKNRVSDSVTKSVFQLSNYLKVDKIVAITKSGYTAQMVSRFRTAIPVIGVCWLKRTEKILSFYFGVKPVLVDKEKTDPKSILSFLKSKKIIGSDETVILTGNFHSDKEQHSNLIEVHRV